MKFMDAPLIIHVVYGFSVGGLENGVVNLINRLPARAWRHAVVSLTEVDPAFAARLTRADVELIAMRKARGHALRLYPRLVQLFRGLKPAIVHTRNLAALEASVPAWLARVPVRVHGEHGRDVNDLDLTRTRYQRVRKMFSPFVTRYVALSPDLAQYLQGRVGIGAARITQIYNGVDTERFRPSREHRVPVEGCPFNDPGLWLIGTVGRMEPVKDQLNLARAFVAAVSTHRDARSRMRLVLIGDGSLRPQVETILNEAGLRDLAWLPGERADVPSILRSLDCFVLPSLGEGVSNTVLEAMASGLPVVATRVGANSELVEDGATGHIVPAADSDALARSIVGYFSDPATARSHGRAGRERAARQFGLERMVEQYHALYTELLHHHPLPEARAARADAHGGHGGV